MMTLMEKKRLCLLNNMYFSNTDLKHFVLEVVTYLNPEILSPETDLIFIEK